MTTEQVRRYWNERIHDLEMTTHPVGSREFFADLDDYRFDKLRYLPELVDFGGFAGRRLLEVGCGIGTDLARFARGGARVTGIDLSQTAIDLARQNFATLGLDGDLRVADGEALPFRRRLVRRRLRPRRAAVRRRSGAADRRSAPACSCRAARPSSWSTTASRG